MEIEAHGDAPLHTHTAARPRCRARRKRANRAFELCGLPAILLIQKSIRGFLVRKAYRRRFQEAVRVKVIVPAAGVLQKCWRGKKGREEGALRRRMWAAAIEIQVRVTEMQGEAWPGGHGMWHDASDIHYTAATLRRWSAKGGQQCCQEIRQDGLGC